MKKTILLLSVFWFSLSLKVSAQITLPYPIPALKDKLHEKLIKKRDALPNLNYINELKSTSTPYVDNNRVTYINAQLIALYSKYDGIDEGLTIKEEILKERMWSYVLYLFDKNRRETTYSEYFAANFRGS